ncbi:hypothetical protein C8F01DRAFT_1017113 [Mycena amicta]|nr:hypothetical protein C8F01DRAFT_1017113 [Mycena amicta]
MLPPELINAVCAFLPNRDLATVARSSLTLYPTALRSLYRTLSITDASCHAVVHTLAHRRDIAAFVRTFSLADVSVCPNDLTAALANMTALLSLDIFVDGLESWVLPAHLVSPQLQHFGSSIPFDAHVAAFCLGARWLQTLHVVSELTDSAALPDACMFPCLTTFTGSASAAVALVPGRPVESIFITSGHLSEDLIPALAKSTARVTVLSTTTNSIPVSLLGSLGRHLPHLIYLQINSTHNLRAPPTTMFYEEVADALASFPFLQSFELSGMYWPSQVQRDEDKRVWQSQPLRAEEALDAPAEDIDEFIFLW